MGFQRPPYQSSLDDHFSEFQVRTYQCSADSLIIVIGMALEFILWRTAVYQFHEWLHQAFVGGLFSEYHRLFLYSSTDVFLIIASKTALISQFDCSAVILVSYFAWVIHLDSSELWRDDYVMIKSKLNHYVIVQ